MQPSYVRIFGVSHFFVETKQRKRNRCFVTTKKGFTRTTRI